VAADFHGDWLPPERGQFADRMMQGREIPHAVAAYVADWQALRKNTPRRRT